MRYSGKHITKCGEILISNDANQIDKSEALVHIEEWRKDHSNPLECLCEQLESLFNSNGLSFIASKRIKRMESIVAKLKNDEQMNLGGLNDIGGIRFVFENTQDLLNADELLCSFTAKDFNYIRKKDYVANPKPSGYRSIHHIFRCTLDEPYNNLYIEVQIRTKIQHSWAMAVETASMIDKVSLKANIDDDSVWRDFFVLASCVFSKEERLPLVAAKSNYSDKELCNEFVIYENTHKLISKLSAIKVVVDNKNPIDDGYYTLLLNFDKRVVNIKSFPKDYINEAYSIFNKIESEISSNQAVLLVSMSKMKELKEAYPSFYLDAESFVNIIKCFYDKCGIII